VSDPFAGLVRFVMLCSKLELSRGVKIIRRDG